MKHVEAISFGAGHQSTAMLLMGLAGLFPVRPDVAIFADTGQEPGHVYQWVERVGKFVHPFPIIRVSKGDIGHDYAVRKIRRAALPCFSTDQQGKPIMMSRFCSRAYKVEPLNRQTRLLVGKKGTARSWIGISTDEAHRGYKPTGKKWIQNYYPLLDAGITREECTAYVLAKMGELPPKSACKFCPFHDEAYWLDQKLNHPEDFEDSCRFDEQIRDLHGDNWDRPRFLHRSMKPLRQVTFRHEGQLSLLDGFGNECYGMCGL